MLLLFPKQDAEKMDMDLDLAQKGAGYLLSGLLFAMGAWLKQRKHPLRSGHDDRHDRLSSLEKRFDEFANKQDANHQENKKEMRDQRVMLDRILATMAKLS